MAWTAKSNEWRGTAAALGILACAVLAGCANEDQYADAGDLPSATYYTVVVRPGDTLSDIADRYDSSTAEVARLNRLGDESRIRPGETLRIPVGGAATREAVLAEAGNSSTHNYAPPPKPIDVARFDSRAHVSVRNLPAPSPEKQAAEDGNAERAHAGSHAARIAAAETSAQNRGHFAWPVAGRVISPFGNVGHGERNDGINIAAATGTPIHAAAAGTVTYAGNELKGYGNLVLIQHDDGYVTAYAHAESVSVTRGDRVEKGQIIALSGATGDVDRPQLHFEIRKGVEPVNPRLLLASRD